MKPLPSPPLARMSSLNRFRSSKPYKQNLLKPCTQISCAVAVAEIAQRHRVFCL